MTGDKNKANTQLLVVILSLLLFAITVLIIVIVIFNTMRNSIVDDLGDDNLAKECLRVDEDFSAKDCLEEKAQSYLDIGDCENALKVYEDIPAGWFDDYSLSDRYEEAYTLSFSCDESVQNYWKNKHDTLLKRLEVRD